MDPQGDSGCEEEDLLSLLLDDVLSHILSFLMVEEATEAKLLSRRWWHLFPTNPALRFDDKELSGHGKNFHSRPELISDTKKFVAWVDTFMQQLRAPKIRSFELNKNVGGEYATCIDEWIRVACLKNAQVIIICSEIRNPYIFPFHLLHAGGSASLEHLALMRCSLPPLTTLAATPIVSLRTLYFWYGFFHLNIGNLELMASCFPNLESLTFIFSRQLLSMRSLCGLWGQLLKLKTLVVEYCDTSEDFEISDVELTKFKYIGGAMNISLKGLNCLIDLDINSLWSGSTFAKFFSTLPKEVPQLIRLSIRSFTWKECQFPSYISTFQCLKHLGLGITSFENEDLRDLINVLQVAPLLQEMNIYIWFGVLSHRAATNILKIEM